MSFTGSVTRRAFLVGTLSATVLTVAPHGPRSGFGALQLDADTTATAWTLNSAWGYPIGPYGKTSCQCPACGPHAANKVFATQSAATDETLRAHLNCRCVPQPYSLATSTYDALFPAGTRSVDRRNPAVAAVLAAGPAPTPTPQPSNPA